LATRRLGSDADRQRTSRILLSIALLVVLVRFVNRERPPARAARQPNFFPTPSLKKSFGAAAEMMAVLAILVFLWLIRAMVVSSVANFRSSFPARRPAALAAWSVAARTWFSGKPEDFADFIQFHLSAGHVGTKHVAKVERIVSVPVKILSHLKSGGGNSVDHRSISEYWQIETVSVESDKLRTEFANLFNEIVYQLGFGPFANVWSAERVYPPTLGLAARNQRAYARYLVKRMFREARTECFSDFGIGRVAKAKHSCPGSEVRHGLKVPNNDGVLGHCLVGLFLRSRLHNTAGIMRMCRHYVHVSNLWTISLVSQKFLNFSTASRSPSNFCFNNNNTTRPISEAGTTTSYSYSSSPQTGLTSSPRSCPPKINVPSALRLARMIATSPGRSRFAIATQLSPIVPSMTMPMIFPSTFALNDFDRKALSSRSEVADEQHQKLSAYLAERAKVDEETRRLTKLFSEALALPAVAGAAGSIDCPLCGSEDSLTPERVTFIRARVTDTEAFKVAEKEARETLSEIDSSLKVVANGVAASLSAFIRKLSKSRRARNFRVAKIRELLRDERKPAIDAWLAALRRLMRRATLGVSVSKLAALIAPCAANPETLTDADTIRVGFAEVIAAYDLFALTLKEYDPLEKALSGALKIVVDAESKTVGWQELIDLARDQANLRVALIDQSAREQLAKEIKQALKQIDTGNEKVRGR